MCAMATLKGVTGLLRPDKLQLIYWLRKCAAEGYTICGWNLAFDIAWLIAMGLREEVYANKWLDGMLLYKHCTISPSMYGKDEFKGFGLKDAVKKFYPDEAGYEHGIDFDTTDPVLIQELFTYNKKDATFSLRLTEKFWAMMSPAQQRCALLEAACLPMVAEANVDGICMDRQAASELSQKLVDDANVAMVTLKLQSQVPVDETIVASTVKLRTLLFESWGLAPLKMTEKGNYSTDKDVLNQLAAKDPRAGLLHNFREARNNRTKFADGTIRSLDYNADGRVRPIARVYSTYTGRMTYSSKAGRGKDQVNIGVALHQWKRDPTFRNLVVPPEGYDLWEFDFAGQEFRWMAVLCRDQRMLSLCAPGEDAHGYMGSRIGGMTYGDMRLALTNADPQAKKLRQLGKVANLSLQYRTSADTLQHVARVQHGITMTSPEAQNIHSTYRLAYPRVDRYWKDQSRIAANQGWVETVAGRRIHTGTGDTWGQNDKWAMTSAAINFPVQGTGADQKYLALAVLRNVLPIYNAHFYYELHDGLFVIVPKDKSERAGPQLKHMLSNLPYKKAWGVDLPIHFPVDAKHSATSWGKMKEIK